MKSNQLLRAILPDVLIDNFDVVNYDKTDTHFDIWLDEKKVMMREDKKYSNVISHSQSPQGFLQKNTQIIETFLLFIC